MKWSLTGGGRLREVVAMSELTVMLIVHGLLFNWKGRFDWERHNFW